MSRAFTLHPSVAINNLPEANPDDDDAVDSRTSRERRRNSSKTSSNDFNQQSALDALRSSRNNNSSGARLPPFRVANLTVRDLQVLREDFERATEEAGVSELDVHAFTELLQRRYSISTAAAHALFTSVDASANGGLDWTEISSYLLVFNNKDDDDDDEDDEEEQEDEGEEQYKGNNNDNNKKKKRSAHATVRDRVTEINLQKNTLFRHYDPCEGSFSPTSGFCHSEQVTRILTHPSVPKMWTCGRDGTLRSWDSNSFEMISIAHYSKSAWLTDATICHGGRRVCVVGSDRTVSLYDTRTDAFWKGFVGVPTGFSSSASATNGIRNVTCPPGLYHPVTRNEINFTRKTRTQKFQQEEQRMKSEHAQTSARMATRGVPGTVLGSNSVLSSANTPSMSRNSNSNNNTDGTASSLFYGGANSSSLKTGANNTTGNNNGKKNSHNSRTRPLELEYIILNDLKCSAMSVVSCESESRAGPMLLGLEDGSVQAYSLEEPNVQRSALDAKHVWNDLHGLSMMHSPNAPSSHHHQHHQRHNHNHSHGFVSALAFDPHLDCAFSAGSDGVIYSLPLRETNRRVRITDKALEDGIGLHSIYRLQSLPDYRLVLSCGSERTVKLWSPTSGLVPPIVLLQSAGSGTIVDAARMDNEPYIVTLDTDKIIKLWDIRTQRVVNQWHDSEQYRPHNTLSVIAVDSTRQRVVTALTAPVVFDVSRAQVPFPQRWYRGHQKPLVRVLACPDRSSGKIATADEDCVRVWSIRDGALMATWTVASLRSTAITAGQAIAGPITSIAFDSTGRRLIILTSTGAAFVVNFLNGLLLQELSSGLDQHHQNNNSNSGKNSKNSKISTTKVINDLTPPHPSQKFQQRFADYQQQQHSGSTAAVAAAAATFSQTAEHLQLEALEVSGERYVTCIRDANLLLWRDTADGIAAMDKKADAIFHVALSHAAYRRLQPYSAFDGHRLTQSELNDERRMWRDPMPSCVASCPPLFIAVGCDAGCVLLFAMVPNFHLFRVFGAVERTVTCHAVSFSRRYDLLFAALSDGRLMAYSVADRKRVWCFDHREPLAGRVPSLRGVSVLDRYISTCDSEGYVYFWSIYDEQEEEEDDDDEEEEDNEVNQQTQQQHQTSHRRPSAASPLTLFSQAAAIRKTITAASSPNDNNSSDNTPTKAARRRRMSCVEALEAKCSGSKHSSSPEQQQSTRDDELAGMARTKVFLPSTSHLTPEATFIGALRAHKDECLSCALFYNVDHDESNSGAKTNPRFVHKLPPRTLFCATASLDCQCRVFDVFTGAFVGFCGQRKVWEPHKKVHLLDKRQMRRKSLSGSNDIVSAAAALSFSLMGHKQTSNNSNNSDDSMEAEQQPQEQQQVADDKKAGDDDDDDPEDPFVALGRRPSQLKHVESDRQQEEQQQRPSEAATPRRRVTVQVNDDAEQQQQQQATDAQEFFAEDVAAIAQDRIRTLTSLDSDAMVAPLDRNNVGCDYYSIVSEALATFTRSVCLARNPLEASAVFDPAAAAAQTPGAVLRGWAALSTSGSGSFFGGRQFMPLRPLNKEQLQQQQPQNQKSQQIRSKEASSASASSTPAANNLQTPHQSHLLHGAAAAAHFSPTSTTRTITMGGDGAQSQQTMIRTKNLRTRMNHKPRTVKASTSSLSPQQRQQQQNNTLVAQRVDDDLPGTVVVAGGDARVQATAILKKEILFGLKQAPQVSDLLTPSPSSYSLGMSTMMSPSSSSVRGGGGGMKSSAQRGVSWAVSEMQQQQQHQKSSQQPPPTTQRTGTVSFVSLREAENPDDALLRSIREPPPPLHSPRANAQVAPHLVPFKPTGSPDSNQHAPQQMQQQKMQQMSSGEWGSSIRSASLRQLSSSNDQDQSKQQQRSSGSNRLPIQPTETPPTRSIEPQQDREIKQHHHEQFAADDLDSFLPAIRQVVQQQQSQQPQQHANTARLPGNSSASAILNRAAGNGTGTGSNTARSYASYLLNSNKQQHHQHQTSIINTSSTTPIAMLLDPNVDPTQLPALDVARHGLRALFKEAQGSGGVGRSHSQHSRNSNSIIAMSRDGSLASPPPAQYLQEGDEELQNRLNTWRMDKQIAKLTTFIERSTSRVSPKNNNSSNGQGNDNNNDDDSDAQQQQQLEQPVQALPGTGLQRFSAYLPPLDFDLRDIKKEQEESVRKLELYGAGGGADKGNRSRHELIELELAKAAVAQTTASRAAVARERASKNKQQRQQQQTRH